MKRFIAALLVGALPFVTSVTASAHVRLDPATAVVGRQVYGVRVPNEKDIPTVSVRLVVPDGVEVTGVMPLSGWSHTEKMMPVEVHAEEEEAAAGHNDEEATERVAEVTWSGGQIAKGEYMMFYVNTNYEGDPAKLVWKAYQTYSDGSIVAWDDSTEEAPAPAVTVTEKSDLEMLKGTVEELKGAQSAPKEQEESFSPDLNTWLAGGALVVAVGALMAGLRKNS